MKISPELKAFISAHLEEDPAKLLLSAARYPEIDIRSAVTQIQARRQIREKLPSWYAQPDLIFPSRLSAEQCSSELTASYKQKLMRGKRFCDLTGGLGIDCLYFARKAETACYVERFTEYCDTARHNFSVWGVPDIEIFNGDCRELLSSLQADTFYADPARRATNGRRVFALTDCEPDILQLKSLLLSKSQRLIIKISPMADLEENLHLLPETGEIHVLAVRNECKELLFVLENGEPLPPGEVCIHAVNLQPDLPPQHFIFKLKEEKEAPLPLAVQPGKYLYEPHAALLKSGAFKLIAIRLGLQKLHRHSHLYTSNDYCSGFPGRIFTLDQVAAFSGKMLKTLSREIPRANLAVRNFPLSVAELRKRSGIKEGGELYLFATTLADEQKVFLITRKATLEKHPDHTNR